MITHPDELQSANEAGLARQLSPEAYDVYIKTRTEASWRLLRAIAFPFRWIRRIAGKK